MIASSIQRSVKFLAVAFLSSSLLVGCDLVRDTDRTSIPAPNPDQVSDDCNLLAEAAESLQTNQRHLAPAILSGCPGRYENRTRTETELREFDNVLAENPAPQEIMATSLEAERLYNRLVEKGVPPNLAAELSVRT